MMPNNYNERYLCLFLSNSKNITDYKAILNFYEEISSIAEKSSNAMSFQLKLQWFMDAIKDNNLSFNPIIDNMKAVLNKYNLQSNIFLPLIEAQTILLDNFPFKNNQAIVNFAKNSSGLLWQVMGLMANPNLSTAEQEALNNVGAAFAIIGVIRNFTYHYSKNIYTLLTNEDTLNNNFNENLAKNVKALTIIAKQLITLSNKQKIKGKANNLKILNNFSLGYIHNIKKANYDIFKTNITTINKYYFFLILKDFLF